MAKRSLQSLPDLSEDVSRLVEDLEKETDRGAALLGAAFLDDVLELVLRSAMVDAPEVIDKLIGGGRALESFGSRAHLAYLMGLLGPDIYADINLIREVRNDFAHRQPTSFDSEEIRDKCKRLQCVSVFYTDEMCTPQERFVVDIVLIANHLLVQAKSQPRPNAGKRFTSSGVLRLK